MPRKVTIYLDTSVPNALMQQPEDRKETTSRFFSEILPSYETFISELVLAEIGATPDPTFRTRLLELVNPFHVLPVSSNAEELSKKYLEYLKIPEADALHVAIASVEGVHYLATWNMRHIAKEKTRKIVDNVNLQLRLPRIYMLTPADFFG